MEISAAPGRQPGRAEAQARADPRASSMPSRRGPADARDRRHEPIAASASSIRPHAADFEAEFAARAALVGRDRRTRSRQRVAAILADVRARGDAAVLEYTRALRRRRRRHRWPTLEITRGRAAGRASTRLPPAQRDALEAAARARAQLPRAPARGLRPKLELPRRRRHAARPEGHAAGPRRHLRAGRQGGLSVERADERDSGEGGRRRRDRHGRADAGRRDATRWCWPPRASPASTASFTIGGAQAVGALAYGTATIPAVDKITGPGNAYVASAKRRVFGTVGIDMIAGPSEILVLADGSTPPDWVAMDLFSQAEHDELAQSILLCPDAGYIDARAGGDRPAAAGDAAPRRDPRLARRPRRADPDAQHGRGLRDQQPHRARAPGSQLRASRSAGSRCSATPARSSSAPSRARAWATTAPARTTCCRPRGTARFSSPLGVYDFQKRSSLIEVSEAGAQRSGRSRPSWPTAKACRRMRARPRCGSNATGPRDERRRSSDAADR